MSCGSSPTSGGHFFKIDFQNSTGYTTFPSPIFYSQCFPLILASRVTAKLVFLCKEILSKEIQRARRIQKHILSVFGGIVPQQIP